MTGLAEVRPLGHQELLVGGPMRRMAREAALGHGGSVLPEERPPLFGVAGVALLVDRVRRDQFVRHRPVRVMAVGALDLSLLDGMTGHLLDLGPYLLVALRAGRRLGQFCGVNGMAIRAGDAPAFVGAAVPHRPREPEAS